MAAPLDYPAFHDAADAASLAGQRRYMGMVGLRLGALVLAALGGAIPWHVGSTEPLVWLSVVAFVVAVGAELVIFQLRPDEVWYEARAAAESAKTLAWRYAVGGDPFPMTASADVVVTAFSQQIGSLTQDLNSVPPPTSATSGEITPSMAVLRASSFDERRNIYLGGRVEDQIAWYGAKAQRNARLQARFLVLALLLEVAGIVGAVLRLTNVVDIDLLGILAALTASVASWAQTRQYGQLSRAYSVANRELMSIRTQAQALNEADWARFVDEAEGAVSREHTLWRASRGLR